MKHPVIPSQGRAHVTCRQGVGGLKPRPGYLPATGFASGAPLRASELLRKAAPARAERLRARFAEMDEIDVPGGAPAMERVLTVPVRAISAVLVEGHWMDHRDPAPMKAAVELFVGRPVHVMHDAHPLAVLGKVLDAEWDDTPMGRAQAPGVNVTVAVWTGMPALDGGAWGRGGDVARLERGIREGVLDRWSLGFCAEYEVSHDDMKDWGFDRFCCLLGTPGPDGEPYRFVVTAIPDVYELSLVDIGAVESARSLDEPETLRTKTPSATAGGTNTTSAPRFKPAAAPLKGAR